MSEPSSGPSSAPESKPISFSLGTQKKSRFQKAKEEESLKKREEDEAADKVLEEYKSAFVDSTNHRDMFVRKGEVVSDRVSYEPKKSYTEPKILPPPETSKGKGRQIDDFFAEIKSRQENLGGKSSHSFDDHGHDEKGSFDNGDPNTTNLFVGGLAPTVTEEVLLEKFGKFGDINSVKVMWPRTDEERARKRNKGFVSFMRRCDAEDALFSLNNSVIDGYHISVGWSKAVKLNSVPLVNNYVYSKATPEADKSKTTPVEPTAEKALETETLANPQDIRNVNSPLDVTSINISVPSRGRELIDLVALYVSKDGEAFENVIKDREYNNPDFSFLFDIESPEGQYYRWRTYSYIMGDSNFSWRTSAFQLSHVGPNIVPPEESNFMKKPEIQQNNRGMKRERNPEGKWRRDMNSNRYAGMTGAQIERLIAEEKKERTSSHPFSNIHSVPLNDEDYDEFNRILRFISIDRPSIRLGMGFAYDKIDSCEDISTLLFHSILEDAPPPVRIARLFLLSDILFNSSSTVKNAGHYRIILQDYIPEIIESLGRMFRNIEGRITSMQVRNHVSNTLAAWTEWSIFAASPMFIIGLEALFFRSIEDDKLIENKVKSLYVEFQKIEETELEKLRSNPEISSLSAKNAALQNSLKSFQNQYFPNLSNTLSLWKFEKLDSDQLFELFWKKSKLFGIHLYSHRNDKNIFVELLTKLNFIENYAKAKLGAPEIQKSVPTDNNSLQINKSVDIKSSSGIDDDIDGEELDEPSGGFFIAEKSSVDVATYFKKVEDVDEEDIDGVPFD